jgi:hypothetical protein
VCVFIAMPVYLPPYHYVQRSPLVETSPVRAPIRLSSSSCEYEVCLPCVIFLLFAVLSLTGCTDCPTDPGDTLLNRSPHSSAGQDPSSKGTRVRALPTRRHIPASQHERYFRLPQTPPSIYYPLRNFVTNYPFSRQMKTKGKLKIMEGGRHYSSTTRLDTLTLAIDEKYLAPSRLFDASSSIRTVFGAEF